MRTFDIRITKKSCNSGVTRAPFIGLDIPFVGHNTPHTLPFVGRKLPLVLIWRSERGFTLIELMITLVILGVLAGFAGPAMRDAVMNNSIATETNDMLVSLMFARSEAIKRATPVVLCKSLDPEASPPSCDTTGSNPWTTGWIVFSDENSNSAYDDGTDVLLRLGDGFSGANKKIKPSTTAIQNTVGFTRLGLLDSDGGSFYICDSRGAAKARVIDITLTGRARINRDATADCT
jgi:type IV fimbrial biogenesis protein FimT